MNFEESGHNASIRTTQLTLDAFYSGGLALLLAGLIIGWDYLDINTFSCCGPGSCDWRAVPTDKLALTDSYLCQALGVDVSKITASNFTGVLQPVSNCYQYGEMRNTTALNDGCNVVSGSLAPSVCSSGSTSGWYRTTILVTTYCSLTLFIIGSLVQLLKFIDEKKRVTVGAGILNPVPGIFRSAIYYLVCLVGFFLCIVIIIFASIGLSKNDAAQRGTVQEAIQYPTVCGKSCKTFPVEFNQKCNNLSGFRASTVERVDKVMGPLPFALSIVGAIVTTPLVLYTVIVVQQLNEQDSQKKLKVEPTMEQTMVASAKYASEEE